jgi:hypothetical protein
MLELLGDIPVLTAVGALVLTWSRGLFGAAATMTPYNARNFHWPYR